MKVAHKCPHCESTNTRFAYWMQSQSRHYCNDCQQHWTLNGKQRDFSFSGGKRERQKPEISASVQGLIALECPRCKATDTKFIKYQSQNESKPLHFCNNCQSHWTLGGTLRDCPGGGKRKRQQAETFMADQAPMSQVTLKCPQCESTNTRFAYYQNHKKSQPCRYCKDCRKHWTVNGKLRDTPVGGGKREGRQSEFSAYDQALVARVGLKCPRCEATSTKFVHYRHKNMSKSVHFCFSCRHHWTVGGNLKNCPNGGKRKIRQPETSMANQARMSQAGLKLKCPRCESINTKFIYYSNQNEPKPVHFCKNCRRYWSAGGSLRTKQQLKDPGLQTSVEGHEETWHCEGSGEMASVGGSDGNDASTECSKSLSLSADNHRPLSVCPAKFNSHIEKGSEGFPINDEVTPNEEVYLSNGLKSVESPELSYVVENSSCVEKCNSSNDFCSNAKGVDKAHHFSVDVTTTTSRQLSLEPPLKSDLPFIKSLFLWPQVESMEVFWSMPQQPHYNPLKDQDEHLREGKAIGLMLSFTKLVEATRKAQLDDSRTIFDMKLKALQILEEHGFSVQPIRSQLVKLLRIKESCRQLNDRLTTVTLEVSEELESVALLDMDIQMLKEKKEMKGFKVAELQRTSVQIEESIRAARSKFDELVAAPW